MALAFGTLRTRKALAVAVANIAVLVLGADLVALITSVTLLADAFGALCFGIQEARALSRAHIAFTSTRAFHTAVLAKEALLALARRGALRTVLLACAALAATADAAEGVFATFHRAITALEASLAKALPTARATRDTGSLAEADAAFAVFGACDLALVPQVPLVAFAECHLFDLVIQTGAMTAAHLRACCPRAPGVTGFPTPWAETLARCLPQLVDCALAIFAANLLTESFRATLGAVAADTAKFTAAMRLLALLVEEARPPS